MPMPWNNEHLAEDVDELEDDEDLDDVDPADEIIADEDEEFR